MADGSPGTRDRATMEGAMSEVAFELSTSDLRGVGTLVLPAPRELSSRRDAPSGTCGEIA